VITIYEGAAMLWREKGHIFRVPFNKILECFKALTSDLFISVGLIIRTIPFTYQFNGQRFLVIHL
jgi:hypothetical protein